MFDITPSEQVIHSNDPTGPTRIRTRQACNRCRSKKIRVNLFIFLCTTLCSDLYSARTMITADPAKIASRGRYIAAIAMLGLMIAQACPRRRLHLYRPLLNHPGAHWLHNSTQPVFWGSLTQLCPRTSPLNLEWQVLRRTPLVRCVRKCLKRYKTYLPLIDAHFTDVAIKLSTAA
jgi:hypothetical protein